jgi:hypothetical protein
VSALSETDAHKAADRVTAGWSVDAAAVEFAPTFSVFPKEVQESEDQKQRDKTKGVFHSDSNTIWVIFAKHENQADVEETLCHEGGHWVLW